MTTDFKRLEFDSATLFYNALLKYSDTDSSQVDYWEDIHPWELANDFVSMRNWYETKLKEFNELDTEDKLKAFTSNYPDLLLRSGDSYQIDPPLGPNLMNVLAPDGTVIIENSLFKFTPNRVFVVLDRDEDKLREAEYTDETNEDRGYFVLKNWRKNEIELRDCGSSVRNLGCEGPQISDTRVRGNWELQLVAIPNRNVYGQVTGWSVGYLWDIQIRGERRCWFGNWCRNRTALGFTSGFGVSSDLFGVTNTGTGWVTEGRSEINHTFIVQGPSFYPGAQPPEGYSNFHITYCTCGAKDGNIPPVSNSHDGSVCYDCCPWDCSDLDWYFIQ